MYERRFSSRIGLRADGYGDARSISGYAATFGSLSSDLGGFKERIQPGAFRNCLRENQDTKMLRDHIPSQLLGRVKNSTLTLSEDSHGLKFRCLLPDTSCGRDTYELVRNGTLSDCSFAFTIDDDDWSEECDPEDKSVRFQCRTIRSVKNLWDTSVVTNPAYLSTSVSADDDPDEADTEWNSARRTAHDLFPLGVPLEIRSHVEAFHHHISPEARAARQRLLSFFIS
jgi:uncharacterized protein